MTDNITKCGNPDKCPFLARCIRHTSPAPDDQLVDYSGFFTPGEKCGHFMMPYPYPQGGDAMT